MPSYRYTAMIKEQKEVKPKPKMNQECYKNVIYAVLSVAITAVICIVSN